MSSRKICPNTTSMRTDVGVGRKLAYAYGHDGVRQIKVDHATLDLRLETFTERENPPLAVPYDSVSLAKPQQRVRHRLNLSSGSSTCLFPRKLLPRCLPSALFLDIIAVPVLGLSPLLPLDQVAQSYSFVMKTRHKRNKRENGEKKLTAQPSDDGSRGVISRG
ncbi:hypothetical protein EV356DRAFT_562823 [Viridothelium virens]|uniref:Uncharacterized protein n=1 Tax=Viridothelium virens TaxID=1048519 RepID=A0A6A6HQD9_VIRVR|nr:hypothetical protein EV356DRAFT_562823 [Viridothelium virens]